MLKDTLGERDISEGNPAFHWGIAAGVGATVDVGPWIGLGLELRYDFGLSQIFEDRGHNRMLSMNAVFTYNYSKDTDRDGLANAHDRKCMFKAEDLDSFQDRDGCPDPDNDGDGIADNRDKAPNKAEDLDNFEDDDGEPDMDNDGDGVTDTEDREGDERDCRNQTSPRHRGDAPNGCFPVKYGSLQVEYDIDTDHKGIERIKSIKSIKPITVEDGLVFDNQDDVTLKIDIGKHDSQKHKEILDDLEKILDDFPEIGIRIRGHASSLDYGTDSEGPLKKGLLGKRRANEVMCHLIEKKSVDKCRLVTVSLSDSEPLVHEGTKDLDAREAAKKTNRRVDFEVLPRYVKDCKQEPVCPLKSWNLKQAEKDAKNSP